MTRKKTKSKEVAEQKGKKKAKERLEAKKEQQKKIIFVAVGLILIVIVAVGIAFINSQDTGKDVEFEKSVTDDSGDNVVINEMEVSDGEFHYFSYDSDGTEVKYFVVKGDDGQIHTAFDACDVCYHAKKGYSQEGDRAKCINCGKTFPVEDLGTENSGGGCWPGMLPHTIVDGQIMIKTTDLERGTYYFE